MREPSEELGTKLVLENEQVRIWEHRVAPAAIGPMHLAVSVSSGSESAIFVADAVIGETNFEFPDWSSRLEVDRAGAVETRRRLLDRAASERSTVLGYHLWVRVSWSGGVSDTSGTRPDDPRMRQ